MTGNISLKENADYKYLNKGKFGGIFGGDKIEFLRDYSIKHLLERIGFDVHPAVEIDMVTALVFVSLALSSGIMEFTKTLG